MISRDISNVRRGKFREEFLKHIVHRDVCYDIVFRFGPEFIKPELIPISGISFNQEGSSFKYSPYEPGGTSISASMAKSTGWRTVPAERDTSEISID